MPAKKRGKGFSTKKRKKKSPPPPSATRPTAAQASASGSKASAARRTPSAAAAKRKEKEALALSAPRRSSLRLQELKTRKMSLENGSLAATMDVEHVQPGDTSDRRRDEEEDGGMDKHVQHASQGKKVSNDAEHDQSDGHETDHDAEGDEQEEEDDPNMSGRATKVMEAPKIDALAQVKEVDEEYADHAVYVYFWNTGFLTPTTDDVKKWIYSVLGDKSSGNLRHCKDLGRGFFFVYFEHAVARTKVLAARPAEAGVQVTVFPWCPETVNENGEQLTPRVIYLPELPLQYLSLLPVIGRSLGAYIGSIGALDPDANLEIVRACKDGWESAYNSTPASEVGNTRIAVLMPSDVKPPAYVQLQVREGVYKKQWIYEQLPGDQVGSKRKYNASGGGGGGSGSRRASKKKRLI